MGPLGVIMIEPARQDRTSQADREEQGFVKELVAHATFEAADEPVLRRLARRDVMPLDAGVAGPGEHRVRGKLGTVTADDHL